MGSIKSDYKISDIYQGGYSSLTPPAYGSKYSTFATGSFGLTTDPRSANILKEVSEKLSTGVKEIEIEGVSPEVFDSIPRQQLKEVNRLSKLTGIDISLHGPVINVSGLDPRSGFSETERELAQRKVAEALERAHELNPDGNVPVNFHSSEGIPGSQMLPPSKRNEKEGDYRNLIVVNKETGRLAPLEPEEVYRPGEGGIKKESHTAEKHLEDLNRTEWDNTISQIEINRHKVDEIMRDVDPVAIGLFINNEVAKNNPKAISKEAMEELENLTPEQSEQMRRVHAAYIYADQATKTAYSAFDKAVKNVSDEEKKILENASKGYKKIMGADDGKKMDLSKALNPQTMNNALFNLIQGGLEKVNPEMYVRVEEFVTDKNSQTYGNASWQAYKKFKDKTPILVIENPPAGQVLSTGEDIKNIVVKAREQFTKNAVESGMSQNEAKRQAEKLIGATWDVGHVNMLRKYGYSSEEIVEEAGKVAPYLKHVHLSDNFGFEHTELPMGMGNVPLKEVMEKLGQKGYDAKKIIEAGHWWQHFRTAPVQETLEAVGSPVYAMEAGPAWSQAPGLYQGYFSGFGQMLPQINYETFGAGFSRLPAELGGTAQGAQGSRMSGRQME